MTDLEAIEASIADLLKNIDSPSVSGAIKLLESAANNLRLCALTKETPVSEFISDITAKPPNVDPGLLHIPQFETEPFAWHGFHINDKHTPGTKPLIFTDPGAANDWALEYSPGFAWLEPLYKRKTTNETN